jgi:Dual specificity phosphatase, catalytic domain
MNVIKERHLAGVDGAGRRASEIFGGKRMEEKKKMQSLLTKFFQPSGDDGSSSSSSSDGLSFVWQLEEKRERERKQAEIARKRAKSVAKAKAKREREKAKREAEREEFKRAAEAKRRGRLIVDRLYLGSKEAAANGDWLDECEISHILNVTSGVANYYESDEDVEYMQIRVADSPDEDLSRHFNDAIEFIDAAVSNASSNVLVHCRQGMSRSPTCIVAYLMAKKRMYLADAYRCVLEANGGELLINDGFKRQLMDFELDWFAELDKGTADLLANGPRERRATELYMPSEIAAPPKATRRRVAKTSAQPSKRRHGLFSTVRSKRVRWKTVAEYQRMRLAEFVCQDDNSMVDDDDSELSSSSSSSESLSFVSTRRLVRSESLPNLFTSSLDADFDDLDTYSMPSSPRESDDDQNCDELRRSLKRQLASIDVKRKGDREEEEEEEQCRAKRQRVM